MIFRFDVSSDWFRAPLGKARWLGLALLLAALGGCAISMPIPGLIDKETTGAIAPKPAKTSADSPAPKPLAAAMRADASAGPAAPAGPDDAEN
jgi:hypothetical protein